MQKTLSNLTPTPYTGAPQPQQLNAPSSFIASHPSVEAQSSTGRHTGHEFSNRALDPRPRSSDRSSTSDLSNGRPIDPVNRNNDPNSWRNQATTYQPLPANGPLVQPTADKPIPDSIINSLTQRVNNKSRPSSANNSSGR